MSDTQPQSKGTLVVDIDGTICHELMQGQSYADVAPRLDVIQQLRSYHTRGYRIVLFTARNMRTHNGNLGLINKHTAPVLFEWLHKWDVPYDEILFGKPWTQTKGFYIDDRAIRPDEFLNLSESEIHKLIGQE
ncbi:MAG: capsular biosynthesis protein [Roseiflexaceae bacterium]